ncbi:MAG: FAD-binding domain-containing protein [Kiloniellales bacterium]|nr:FAD-binding domain-containing protein [Kiloniellales bacterium]
MGALAEVQNRAWLPSRAEGLRRLEAFLPRAGRRYAETRNYDQGAGAHDNVSTLSPWIRHRLVTEDEVIRAVLGRHSFRAAEKFIQEVCWRTYWKGWLEMRPGIWHAYRAEVDAGLAALDDDAASRRRWQAAVEARSGIACFDAWAGELVSTGYLHNHARMWFASIWIFTLKLPWALGADFFLRHLLDGDPASNTLSWRWVAGLHTRGKTYLARPGNIETYTRGRFRPGAELSGRAPALSEPPAPAPTPLPSAVSRAPAEPSALLITEEDLRIEDLGLEDGRVLGIAGAVCTAARSPLGAGTLAADFARGALRDGLDRAGRGLGLTPSALTEGIEAKELAAWARELSVRQVVTPYAPVGPVQEKLDRIEAALRLEGIQLLRLRRRWDDAFWPHATKGFFGLKRQIPAVFARLGLN